MEKRYCCCSSWVCTLITQICLCLALYIALNLGQPHRLVNLNNTNANANANANDDDIYFISVRGGFRPLITKQFHLLNMMEKVARDYKASFVVCSSDLGELDPLMHNATHHNHHFPSLTLVPWYTSSIASKSEVEEVGCFEKKIMMTNGKTLDLIGLDTQLLQDSILSGIRNNHLHCLIRTLQQNGSNWRIFVGSQPLVICGRSREKMNNKKQAYYDYLHHLFRKFAVNVYLSGQDCTNHVTDGSVAYIGNPGLIEKQPYSVFLNGKSLLTRDLTNGFLLHRVTSIQIVTYYINFTGEVAFKTVLQQKGTEVM